MTPFENLYIQFASNDGGHATIRKWSQFPFEGATGYAVVDVGTPAPIGAELMHDANCFALSQPEDMLVCSPEGAVVIAKAIINDRQRRTPPAPEPHLLPPVVTGQMEIETDVTAADLGVNAEPPAPEDPREEMRTAAASIREWMPETLPANEAGQIHFARALAESAAEAIERYLATTDGSTDE